MAAEVGQRFSGWSNLDLHYNDQCTLNQSSSLIHIPRNSENRNSQDSKDSFHQRIEMQLRALSDRMTANKAAAASKLASHQSSNRSSYGYADRVPTSSRSASSQNTDRGFAPSKSTAQENQSSSLIHIPRVGLRRNSENRNSQDSKDSFHQRIEMQLRALSDRMTAIKAAAASKLASRQSFNRSSYGYADRVSTSSRSASSQNTDRGFAPSKSTAQASHKSFEEVRPAATLSRANMYSKRSHVSHVASSNSNAAEKLAARSSLVSSSSQTNAKPFQATRVTSKRAANLTSVSSGSQNKRKQLSIPLALDENNQSRGFMNISSPTSARSIYKSSRPYKTAKATNVSNGKTVTKTGIVEKSTYGSHAVGGRNAVPKRTVNSREQSRKVISSHADSLTCSTRNNLASGVSLSKNKPRQERPKWL